MRRQIDNEGRIVLGRNSCNIQNAEGAIQPNDTLNILARGKSTVCMRGDGGPMYATQASFQCSWPLSEVIFHRRLRNLGDPLAGSVWGK